MEWRNQYNSFSSLKGLTYFDHYKQIQAWLDGADYLPPPIECNLDPIADCNLNCYFCITQRYLKDDQGEMRKLPTDYMKLLVDFLVDWGVQGLCISGGGEPTLHEGLPTLIRQSDMDVCVVTNATHLTPDLSFALMKCRWIALSIDAPDEKIYEMVKGKGQFTTAIRSIRRLVQQRRLTDAKVDLCFKYLILPENQYGIFRACQIAKELGVQDFHVRPVDFQRSDIEGAKPLELNIIAILEQFDRCHELETDDFHVYTVTHKFDPEFHVKHDYEKCLAAPLILPVLSDGNAYLCVEHKMEEKYRLGSTYPNPLSIMEWWGGDRHRDMIKGIVPDRDCSRCIYSQYHRQMTEVVELDRMCRSFP